MRGDLVLEACSAALRRRPVHIAASGMVRGAVCLVQWW